MTAPAITESASASTPSGPPSEFTGKTIYRPDALPGAWQFGSGADLQSGRLNGLNAASRGVVGTSSLVEPASWSTALRNALGNPLGNPFGMKNTLGQPAQTNSSLEPEQVTNRTAGPHSEANAALATSAHGDTTAEQTVPTLSKASSAGATPWLAKYRAAKSPLRATSSVTATAKIATAQSRSTSHNPDVDPVEDAFRRNLKSTANAKSESRQSDRDTSQPAGTSVNTYAEAGSSPAAHSGQNSRFLPLFRPNLEASGVGALSPRDSNLSDPSLSGSSPARSSLAATNRTPWVFSATESPISPRSIQASPRVETTGALGMEPSRAAAAEEFEQPVAGYHVSPKAQIAAKSTSISGLGRESPVGSRANSESADAACQSAGRSDSQMNLDASKTVLSLPFSNRTLQAISQAGLGSALTVPQTLTGSEPAQGHPTEPSQRLTSALGSNAQGTSLNSITSLSAQEGVVQGSVSYHVSSSNQTPGKDPTPLRSQTPSSTSFAASASRPAEAAANPLDRIVPEADEDNRNMVAWSHSGTALSGTQSQTTMERATAAEGTPSQNEAPSGPDSAPSLASPHAGGSNGVFPGLARASAQARPLTSSKMRTSASVSAAGSSVGGAEQRHDLTSSELAGFAISGGGAIGSNSLQTPSVHGADLGQVGQSDSFAFPAQTQVNSSSVLNDNPFQSMDSEGLIQSERTGAAGVTSSSNYVTHLQVGYQDPVLGYVELRAHNSGGAVHAELGVQSEASGQILEGHLTSLAGWMHDHNATAQTLTIANLESSLNPKSFSSGNGSGGSNTGGAGTPGRQAEGQTAFKDSADSRAPVQESFSGPALETARSTVAMTSTGVTSSQTAGAALGIKGTDLASGGWKFETETGNVGRISLLA